MASALIMKVKDVQSNLPTSCITVCHDETGIGVLPEGCGCLEVERCPPILLERANGVWMLYVWSDINQVDPTHIIDMSGSLESNREEDQ